jgi:GTP-binding protein LepA
VRYVVRNLPGVDLQRPDFSEPFVEPAPEQPAESYGEWRTRTGDIFSPKVPNDEPLRLECQEFVDAIGEGREPRCGGREGLAVVEVLEAIVERIPAPKGQPEAPTRALIFDSEFDQYRGVIAYVRMVDGSFRKHQPILAMQNGTEAEIDDIGFFRPAMTATGGMEAGDVGYLITGILDISRIES